MKIIDKVCGKIGLIDSDEEKKLKEELEQEEQEVDEEEEEEMAKFERPGGTGGDVGAQCCRFHECCFRAGEWRQSQDEGHRHRAEDVR